MTLHHVDIGSGRPILVLHGGKLDHRHMLDAVEPAFAGIDGWMRVYADLPGCGGSAAPEAVRSQDDVLDSVLEFARARFGTEPWAIIGESRGSYIAQGLAHRAPEAVAGLCLIVPGGFPTDPPPRIPDPKPIVAAPELLAGLEPAIRGRADLLVVQKEELIEKVRTLKVPAAAVHDADLEARVAANFLFSFHDEMLGSLFDKPSLILSGRQDSISGYADTVEMLECYPRATYGLLDTAGHSLSWERPELFRALLADWLVRLEQA